MQELIFVSFFFPAKGFLGTGAPFAADLNLVLQLIMEAALIAGVLLAKKKCYKAHGICQTTVLLLNLVVIGLVMGRRSSNKWNQRCYTVFISGITGRLYYTRPWG
jgi:uncharacterized membrane protein YozB (DUF420 family)